MIAFLEQHGFDTCPEVLILRDGWGGKAFYEVQEAYSETSQRPQTEDIAGRDLRAPASRNAIYRPLLKDGRAVDTEGVPLERGDSGELVEGMRFTLSGRIIQILPERV
jgi:hypothetical protein